MHKINVLAFSMTALLLSACEQQGDDRLQEKSRIEGAAQTQEQLRQEQTLLQSKVSAMESDLAEKHDFYETNGGHFKGSLVRGSDSFQIKISLLPSLPRYRGKRTRSLAEVEAELVALSYNAQVIQWSKENPLSSVGCRFEGIKPDFKTGQLALISPNCPTTYFLNLQRTAIKGTAQPSTNPELFDVYAEKISGSETIGGK